VLQENIGILRASDRAKVKVLDAIEMTPESEP